MPESLFIKIEKETPIQVFFCESVKFLKTPFLQNTSGDCFCILLEEEKHSHHSKLEADMIYCYVPIGNVYTKFGFGIF